MNDVPYHIRLLHTMFEHRRSKNPRYSLRAFSKSLGMDSSAMSRVLRGKQELTPGNCTEILRKLKLGRAQQRLFIRSLMTQRFEREYASIIKSARAGQNVAPLPAVVNCNTDYQVTLKIASEDLAELDTHVSQFLEHMRDFEETDATSSTHSFSLRLDQLKKST